MNFDKDVKIKWGNWKRKEIEEYDSYNGYIAVISPDEEHTKWWVVKPKDEELILVPVCVKIGEILFFFLFC